MNCICCRTKSDQLSLHEGCPKCIRLPKCNKLGLATGGTHGLVAQKVERRFEAPKATVSKTV